MGKIAFVTMAIGGSTSKRVDLIRFKGTEVSVIITQMDSVREFSCVEEGDVDTLKDLRT